MRPARNRGRDPGGRRPDPGGGRGGGPGRDDDHGAAAVLQHPGAAQIFKDRRHRDGPHHRGPGQPGAVPPRGLFQADPQRARRSRPGRRRPMPPTGWPTSSARRPGATSCRSNPRAGRWRFPAGWRHRRLCERPARAIYTFVNRRHVHSRVVQHGLMEGYARAA